MNPTLQASILALAEEYSTYFWHNATEHALLSLGHSEGESKFISEGVASGFRKGALWGLKQGEAERDRMRAALEEIRRSNFDFPESYRIVAREALSALEEKK